MNIIIRIVAFITRRNLVWLEDYDGEVTLSIEQVTPFGKRTAKRWRRNSDINVILCDDGTTEGLAYVKKWKYA